MVVRRKRKLERAGVLMAMRSNDDSLQIHRYWEGSHVNKTYSSSPAVVSSLSESYSRECSL